MRSASSGLFADFAGFGRINRGLDSPSNFVYSLTNHDNQILSPCHDRLTSHVSQVGFEFDPRHTSFREVVAKYTF